MLRVLIIEDSAAMRTHVRATLEAAHEIGETLEIADTASGFEALRLLYQGAYQLVILDIRLPDIDGLDLIRFIRQSQNHRDVALVILSSFSSDRDRERAFMLGAHAFVAKPFAPKALADAVVRSLAAQKARWRLAT